MCTVVRKEAHNKMGPKNVAIVMGPNLFTPSGTTDPMNALMISQKAVYLFQCLVVHRLRTVHDYTPVDF